MDDAFFAENSLVEINVPEDPNLDIEAALSAPEPDAEEQVTSLIPSVHQRTTLYFDEALPIYVVIRVPREDEAALRARISRLAVLIEAHVQNESDSAQSHQKDGPPQRDVIWTGKLNTTEEPIVVMEESVEEEDLATALLLWKLVVTLNRPRIRISSAVVSWIVHATLEPASRARMVQRSKYLPSGIPLTSNLLESLRDESSSNAKAPYLPSNRLVRYSDQERAAATQSHPLQNLDRQPLQALPALSSRVRFHRSHKVGDLPTITASLELEIPPYAPSETDILAVRLKLARGKVVEISKENAVQLPKTCRGRDNLIWLYTLSPLEAFEDPTATASPIHSLQVEVDARVNVSDICRPLIGVRWRTNVDFTSAANTIRGAIPPATSNQPPGRPLSQNRPGSGTDRPTSRSSTDTARPTGGGPETEGPEFTVSFVPTGPVYVGEPFKWAVTVVNRTNKHRQLSLTAVQKRKRQTGKRHSHQSSTGSVTAVSKSGAVADAHVDENLLYATVKSSGPDVAHLVSIDADVRVGLLAPGAAAAVEMGFLPLVEGYLQPDAIRIIDVQSNEFCDVRQLPSIVAVARA